MANRRKLIGLAHWIQPAEFPSVAKDVVNDPVRQQGDDVSSIAAH